MNVVVVMLHFGRYANLLSMSSRSIPSEDIPILALDVNGNGWDLAPFELEVVDFKDDFFNIMDSMLEDDLFPGKLWIIVYGDRIAMAAVSRTMYPRCQLMINQQSAFIAENFSSI